MLSVGAQLFRELASLLHRCHPTGLLQPTPRPLLVFPISSKRERTTASVLFSSFRSFPLQCNQIWGLRYSGTLENSNTIYRNKFALPEIFQNLAWSTILEIMWKLCSFFLGKKKTTGKLIKETD